MNKRLLFLSVLASAVARPALAQYPKIPPEEQAKADAALAEAEKRSDEAWKKALPIIEAEAKAGKPYVPWAAKPSDLPQSSRLAFPGAEGGGAHVFGGQGGKVYVVRSLADSGPGTLREALEQGGARIIVFNVAGIIRLQSPIIIRAPYVTLAGQTAPGDGICVAGESIWINTHDVVVRYLRFRRGATDVARRDDGLGGNPVGNIIIDHVSASWGLDENMSIYRHVYHNPATGKADKLPTVNVTIQNSIFSEGLDTYNHAFGSTIGGLNSLFTRNLWANNIARNPSVGMYGDFNFANNVVFNWWNRSADGGDNNSEYNFVNNYYKPGPITPAGQPISYRILKPESGRDKDQAKKFGKAYVAGNVVEGNAKVTQDNWAGGVQLEDLPDADTFLAEIKTDKPFTLPGMNTVLPAQEAYQYVLANAGCSLPRRDAVDARIVEDVRTGKISYAKNAQPTPQSPYIKRRLPADSYKQGIITDPAQVGGYPVYQGKPYADADNDGMPDAWETKHGLNPKNAADATQDRDKDGYANIEEYLNSVVPLQTVHPAAGKAKS
ncbi:pectate lyase family protein [Hymenobacter cellulosivorans]|uniref:Polysaccharide lyase n=1 Tax=Hymenobacter cellulosivorans TaxID=2932249 RepID=A0ABY4F3G6_9BACT|nr:polysaccharide lyase [Hymenobacter cellulosivorans]UOQ51105.1 polysaccharide lyase [Hymenobacter cellulosivorans]